MVFLGNPLDVIFCLGMMCRVESNETPQNAAQNHF